MHIPLAPTRAALTLMAAAMIAVTAGAAHAEGINPTPAQPGTPPSASPGEALASVKKTPNHLCRPGSNKFVTATRPLSLPSQRYCTDADWNVRDVRVDGANLMWRVPFTNGHVDCLCTYAAGTTPAPTPSTGDTPTPPPATGASDRVTAAIVMRELRALGYQAQLSTASDGDPRVAVTVEGYKWAVFFYGCAKSGDLDQRSCLSLQFFSGYTVSQPISTFTMNKFNAENRYIRAYSATTSSGQAARISMDVMFGGTGADPAKNFRAHLNMMKHQTVQFRKLINFN